MIYCIIGPSGSGKTTLVNRLRADGGYVITSTTTRPRRAGEMDGDEYHFVNRTIFERLSMVETSGYAGNWYGLQKQDVQRALKDTDSDHFVVLDRNGVLAIKTFIKENYHPSVMDTVKVIYLKQTARQLVEYMVSRGDDEQKIIDRLVNIIHSNEMNNDDIADFVFENLTTDEMVKEFEKIYESL